MSTTDNTYRNGHAPGVTFPDREKQDAETLMLLHSLSELMLRLNQLMLAMAQQQAVMADELADMKRRYG